MTSPSEKQWIMQIYEILEKIEHLTKLEKAKKLLQYLSGKNILINRVETISNKDFNEWKISKGL
jgi:hypothetical protein